ncbi:MAG: OmpH family outer membrane protein [Hyphomonadaceae bacterium]
MIAAIVSGSASAAFAQTKVFVIDEQKIRRESKIGQDIESKLGAIKDKGVETLGLEKLESDIKAEEARLQPQVQSLTKEALDKNPTLKAQVEALGKKQVELAQKANALNNNLDKQNTAASVAFLSALGPAVDAVAKEVGADLVLSYSSTWYVADATDISKKVIAKLDATAPSLDALQAAQKPSN